MVKKQTGAGIVLLAFIIIVISLAFINTISDNVYENTRTFGAVNESLEFNSSRIHGTHDINQSINYSLSHGDLASVTRIVTQNGTVLTLNTDYNVSLAGVGITFLNSSRMGNTSDLAGANSNLSLVTYTYNPTEYVDHASSRTILTLINIFVVLGMLLLVIGIIMKFIFDVNIIDYVRRL
jgi:hypothetical protein